MSFRIDDPIFDRKGEPGVVSGVNKISQKMRVDQQETRKATRHGYIKGLSPKLRREFNSLMDDVKGLESSKGKIEKLQGKIRELEEHSSPQNQVLIGYVKAELAHIMHSSNYSPRSFTVSEGHIT